MDKLRRVVIVGTGVIGTSIALALRARGVDVGLTDRDPVALRMAEELGAGQRWIGGGPADLAVLAVPPHAVASTLRQAQRDDLARVYTDVASVKRQPLVDAARTGCDLAGFVGGHPLAGRERSGPAAARADLFLGRAWVLCPPSSFAEVTDADTEDAGHAGDAVDTVTALIRACGAEPVRLDLAAHDHAVALVSHLPHLVASAAAARLVSADEVALGLAGQGLRDTTRVAAGDPDLWMDILSANPGPVAEVLEGLVGDLTDALASLRRAAAASDDDGGEGKDVDGDLAHLLRRGRDGRARVPGKGGNPAPDYTVVPVVIRDQPGELGRLFGAAAEAGVNVEDVGLEHSPGLPVGVVELSVRPDQVEVLISRLGADGWSVQAEVVETSG